uniref:Membrane-bound transcription factor site-2 protease n=2 Tax=Timema TaxID=61471 RepID=A0A7R9FLA3_9NEOP|nr:unnamed protein product [Timema tahoe]
MCFVHLHHSGAQHDKTCLHLPYFYCLQNMGLKVEAFRLVWFTTTFNRFIQKWGTWRPRLLQCWFTVGSWFSLGLIPLAVYLVIKATFDIWHRNIDAGGKKSSVVLEPMIPGVNLPLGDIGYYSLTLITCSVIHELGHAIAAVREDVHISGMGLMLVVICPVAYVQLNSEQLEALPPRRQLRVLCAGVWHNIMLSVLAALMLLVLPLVLYPFYDVGNGVFVQHIEKNSRVQGPTGLRPDDRVVNINQCEVSDTEDWYYCILAAVRENSPGYCVTTELVRENDESVPVRQLSGGSVECCIATNSDHLCYEYLEKDEGTPELPQHSCLPGRVVAESAHHLCINPNDCAADFHCLKPSLENSTKLVRIERTGAKLVLFLGHPTEIYHTVRVSDYVPMHKFLSPTLPEMIARFCKYLTVFSAGFAIINIIPCFYLDGLYIMRSVADLLLARKVQHRSDRHAVATCITVLGSCFLALNFVSMIVSELF